MQTVLIIAAGLASCIWLSSWQASLLVGVVLLTRVLLGRLLPVRVGYLLWCVVLARLVVPVFPQSEWSVFNLTPRLSLTTVSQATAGFRPAGKLDSDVAATSDVFRSFGPVDRFPASAGAIRNDDASSALSGSAPFAMIDADQARGVPPVSAGLRTLIVVVWLAGVILLMSRMAIGCRRLSRQMINATAVTDPAVLEVLACCRRDVGVSRHVPLVVVDDEISPAATGVVRPRILISRRVLESFTHSELRYVLLHELVHIRRHDVAVNWLTSIMGIVHWFNPVVRFALRRLRFDRELACDSLVLARTGEAHVADYGHTAIKLLSLVSARRTVPGAVGILDHRSDVERRIAMIGQFRKPSRAKQLLGTIVLLLISAFGLTDASLSDDGSPPRNAEEPVAKDAAASAGPTQVSSRAEEARTNLEVFKPERGVIVRIPAETGAPVRKGKSLAELSSEQVERRLDSATGDAGAETEDSTAQVSVDLLAHADGSLRSIRFESDHLGAGDKAYDELARRMRQWASTRDRPDISKREVAIGVQHHLKYEFVTRAISVCSGEKNPDTGRMRRFVHRVRFKIDPPDDDHRVTLNVAFIRDRQGKRLSPKPLVFWEGLILPVGPGVKEQLSVWLKEQPAPAKEITVVLRADADVETKSIQQLIKHAQALGFEQFTLRAVNPGDDGQSRRHSMVVHLQQLAASQVAGAIRQLFGRDASPTVLAEPLTNTLLITADSEGVLRQVRDLLHKLGENPGPRPPAH